MNVRTSKKMWALKWVLTVLLLANVLPSVSAMGQEVSQGSVLSANSADSAYQAVAHEATAQVVQLTAVSSVESANQADPGEVTSLSLASLAVATDEAEQAYIELIESKLSEIEQEIDAIRIDAEVASETTLHEETIHLVTEEEVLTDLADATPSDEQNPSKRSKRAIETVADAASLGHSIYEYKKNPTLTNGLFMAWDAAAVAIPVVPGSYAAKGVKAIADSATSAKQVANSGRGINNMKYDSTATGNHTVIKRDPITQEVTHWQAFNKPVNQNPNPFAPGNAYHGRAKPNDNHHNSATGEKFGVPHVHDRTVPGGIRHPRPDEMPRKP